METKQMCHCCKISRPCFDFIKTPYCSIFLSSFYWEAETRVLSSATSSTVGRCCFDFVKTADLDLTWKQCRLPRGSQVVVGILSTRVYYSLVYRLWYTIVYCKLWYMVYGIWYIYIATSAPMGCCWRSKVRVVVPPSPPYLSQDIL